MGRRFLAPVAFAVALAFVALEVPIAGQAPAPKPTTSAKPWTAPKLPWGDPDLQGIWSSDDMRGVPMQRPATFGERAFLNDEEFAQRDKANIAQRLQADNAIGSFRNDVGTRTFRMASLVVDPPDGRTPPMTPEAQKRQAAVQAARGRRPDSWFDRSLYDRCITRGVLGSTLPVIYGNGNQIVQGPGFVAITYEMVHDTRVIPLDGRPHAGQSIRSYLGDPRGRWEGNTLVVETTNFHDRTSGIGPNGGGVSTSDALRLVERFTRVDAETIDYHATIEDPKTWTKPWQIQMPLTTQPGYLFLAYECHEGNLALPNILSGARAEERASAEAIAKGLPPPTSQWGGAAPARGRGAGPGRGQGGGNDEQGPPPAAGRGRE